MINLDDEEKKSRFDIDRHCEVYNIVFNNHKLFLSCNSLYTNEILISTMSGNIMGCIPLPKHQTPSKFQIAQFGDKIYFTCKSKTCEKVVCCDLTGDILWKFGGKKDSSKSPGQQLPWTVFQFRTDYYYNDSSKSSLAVDKYGNVVVSDRSAGLQAISCDGKIGKVIHNEPTTIIDYDMNLNMLVLLNGYEATLYKIIY